MNELTNAVWAERYRPKSIGELITTKEIGQLVQGLLDKGVVGNYLLVGRPGIGKTTIARMLMDVLGFEYILINASLEGNIDTLRTKVQQFASTISFDGRRKYVIFDEADYSNATSTQPALRGFIDLFAGNCGFIFTANYKNRIIQPLQDRLSTIEFTIPKAQYPRLAMEFTKRATYILEQEGVTTIDQDVLARFIITNTPNWRTIINELQKYVTQTGVIDSGLLASQAKSNVDTLIKPLLVEKNYTNVRKWVANNVNNDPGQIYTTLADVLPNHLVDQSIGDLIIIVAKYQYQAAFVADQQVNLAACLAEIMAVCLAK